MAVGLFVFPRNSCSIYLKFIYFGIYFSHQNGFFFLRKRCDFSCSSTSVLHALVEKKETGFLKFKNLHPFKYTSTNAHTWRENKTCLRAFFVFHSSVFFPFHCDMRLIFIVGISFFLFRCVKIFMGDSQR